MIYLLHTTKIRDTIQNILKKEATMEKNIKNLKKVTLEEQTQIEEAFEKICAYVAQAALEWANHSSYISDGVIKEIKKLNDLLNEFLNVRFSMLLKRCGINIENLEKDILKDTIVRTLNANPTSTFTDFFGNHLNIGYLKLLGKKELFEAHGITVAPLEKLLENIEDEVNQDVIGEIEIHYAEAIYAYLNTLSNRIANRKQIINYINSYGEDLVRILTEKYLLAYPKVINQMQSKLEEETVAVSDCTILNKEPSAQAKAAYGRVAERMWFVFPPFQCHCNGGKCTFELSKPFDLKDKVYDFLNNSLSAPTFVSFLGKESLNEEEIKAIEEITSNHEIKNYDEMVAILLKLRKKDNSGNYNK